VCLPGPFGHMLRQDAIDLAASIRHQEARRQARHLRRRRRGQANHFPSLADHVELRELRGIDDHDISVVTSIRRCRAAGQTCIGRLHDNDLVGRRRKPRAHAIAGRAYEGARLPAPCHHRSESPSDMGDRVLRVTRLSRLPDPFREAREIFAALDHGSSEPSGNRWT